MIPQDRMQQELAAMQQPQPMDQQQQQQQPMEQPTQQPLPNIKQSLLLTLSLLDDVIQRDNLNLQVHVQAINSLTNSVKMLADILDRPSQGERVMNMIARTKPEMMSQVGQMGQVRTPDETPQVMDNLQAQNYQGFGVPPSGVQGI